MKTQENSKQTDLVYQKQLLGTLQKMVDFRTTLLAEAAIIANDGKLKEWPSATSQIKQVKKRLEKGDDKNLSVIAALLKSIEEPILQLENNLELKNNFRTVIEEQSMQEKQEVAAV